jgi:phosphoribosylformimino-5-aminoimidazole carboxamide ribotide isomerase
MVQHRQGPAGDTGFEVLPAIDLRGRRVVRLVEGDFGRETVYGEDPEAVARAFAEAGARWIHVVDLDGARDGARRQADVVARVVAAAGRGVVCEVAGGLRDDASVAAAFGIGAGRVVIGTAALDDPRFAGRMAAEYGADRVAVALDVRAGLAVGRGWVPSAPAVPVVEAVTALAERGVGIFVGTAIDRDGLLGGPDLDLLGAIVGLGAGKVIASAGVSSVRDLAACRRIGCGGAIVGRAVYEGRLDLRDAVRFARAGA